MWEIRRLQRRTQTTTAPRLVWPLERHLQLLLSHRGTLRWQAGPLPSKLLERPPPVTLPRTPPPAAQGAPCPRAARNILLTGALGWGASLLQPAWCCCCPPVLP
eukprot:scaffold102360_cov19-Tisochrysis_lutea.AAC.2